MSSYKKSKTILEMGTTNRDASQITKKKRGVAEYSYYLNWSAATVANPRATPTGPATTSAEVIGEIYVGGVAAIAYNNSLLTPNPDPNHPVYPFNPSSGGAGRTY